MSKYALTVEEREWLYVRKINLLESNVYRYFIDMGRYGLTDYMDAAEFASRVAVIALRLGIEDVPCAQGMDMFCPAKHFKGQGCGDWCRMRMAHLQAEEEMDQ